MNFGFQRIVYFKGRFLHALQGNDQQTLVRNKKNLEYWLPTKDLFLVSLGICKCGFHWQIAVPILKPKSTVTCPKCLTKYDFPYEIQVSEARGDLP